MEDEGRGLARAEGKMNDTDARLWHPLAPHQPRPPRDAARALERGGVVAGEGGVHQGARAPEPDPARGLVRTPWHATQRAAWGGADEDRVGVH